MAGGRFRSCKSLTVSRSVSRLSPAGAANNEVTLTAVHGDEAEHTCYYQAQHVRLGLAGGDKFLGGGRYDDRLRRAADGWLFTHRKIISVWSEGNPAVIAS